MPGSIKWSLSMSIPHQIPQYAPPHSCCIPHTSLSSWFNEQNYGCYYLIILLFQIWLYRQCQKLHSFWFVYMYRTDLFSCTFITVILVLNWIIRMTIYILTASTVCWLPGKYFWTKIHLERKRTCRMSFWHSSLLIAFFPTRCKNFLS